MFAIIVAAVKHSVTSWVQAVDGLLKRITKPMSTAARLVAGAGRDMTRSTAELIAKNALLRQQVLARNADDSGGYGLECQTQPLWEGLDAAARGLAEALARVEAPLGALRKNLLESLDEEAGDLETE